MIYIKILSLKIARIFAVLIWNIIRFFRWNKNIDLKNIKKIIFNRKDRIGDAVITKPFIILFSKYIREELKLNIEIEVECSKYNEFVFKEWDGEKYYNIKSKDSKQLDYWKWMIELMKFFLKSFIKNIEIRKNYDKKNRNNVYIDLEGNYNHIIDKMSLWNFYFIGPNLFFHNYLLDYSLPKNYVSWIKINLIQSYINLVSWCFKLNRFEKYVNDNIEIFYSDYNYKEREWILIFIWNKEFRNLSIDTRNKLIIEIWNQKKNKNIVVLDDNQNILYNKLLKYKNYPNNVSFKMNNFSWNELKNFAKNFELIVWIDWWWFNYIRTCTNSLEIFTLANPKVRSIFIWHKKYYWTKLRKKRVINTCNINWKNFWYINKTHFFLPSYDYPITSKAFEDIKILLK